MKRSWTKRPAIKHALDGREEDRRSTASVAQAITHSNGIGGRQNRWSDLGIFLSRWLLSPLGPWINLYSGLTHYSWVRFSLLVIAGEFVWVSVYLGAGMLFSSSVAALADILGSLTWFLVTGTVAIALGWKLVTMLRSKSNPDKVRS
nr:DedA family protein [Rhizobium sp. Khangiran2]